MASNKSLFLNYNIKIILLGTKTSIIYIYKKGKKKFHFFINLVVKTKKFYFQSFFINFLLYKYKNYSHTSLFFFVVNIVTLFSHTNFLASFYFNINFIIILRLLIIIDV